AVAPRHGDRRRAGTGFPWPTAAALLLVLSGVSLGLLDAGARNELLRLAHRVTAAPSPDPLQGAEKTGSGSASATDLLPLPPASVGGVILLTGGRTYQARDLTSERPLVIR